MKSHQSVSKLLFYLFLATLSLSWAPAVKAEKQILLLRGENKNTVEQKRLELAARYYGLRLETFDVQSDADVPSAMEQLKNAETLGVIADVAAIQHLQRSQIFSGLRRPRSVDVPLLIVGISSSLDPNTLSQWSEGSVSSCQTIALDIVNKGYVVGFDEVTQQLGGIRPRSPLSARCAFGLKNSQAKPLLSVEVDQGPSAVFVRAATGSSNRVFFLAEMEPFSRPENELQTNFDDIFAQFAPFLIFVRFASGEYGWHSPGQFADLTIDDPWLTEPYGFLNYESLWAEMEKHHFHTTIAFIPWNFDRSDPQLVAFLRSHPGKFSFAVHGDNHDHAEFASYDSKSPKQQVVNIKQALARMNRFRELTALPFDPVMVFPNEVVPPQPTLSKLNEYGFTAATNTIIVPLSSKRPSDPLFRLRAMSSDFGTFGLVRRYPVELHDPKAEAAMHGFLGDPLLFYCHQDFFAGGTGAFDSLADTVNGLQPDTHWDGLGGAVRHLYLLKRQDESHYDVWDFSSDFILENESQQDRTYSVQKTEDGLNAIQDVTINGQSSPYHISDGELRIAVLVPKGGSSRIAVRYQNDLDLAAVDISKKSLYITVLRRASDFRDITFSKFASGRAITSFYYKHNLNGTEVKLEEWLPILLLLLGLSIAAVSIKRARARKLVIPRLPNRTSH